MAEYPDFVPKYTETTESIRARMEGWADPGLNPREGDVLYDLTEPSVREFELEWDIANDVIAVGFLMYANGVYLDYKAAEYNTFRLAAVKATGEVTFTGSNGAIVPAGTVVSTAAANDNEVPVEFVTLEEGVVSGTTVTVAAEAVEAGRAGKVGVGAITLINSLVNGVTAVTNADLFLGGTDVETDDELRERAMDAAQEPQGAGTPADYLRWIRSVSGVGSGSAVFPRWAGVNTVRVSLVDPDSSPVNQATLDAVQRFLTGNVKLADPTTTPTFAAMSAGSITLTNLRYKVAFTDGSGTTKPGPASATQSPSAQQVNLTNIPIGPAGTTARKLYRSINGGTYYLHATIANNSATTYTDNAAAAGTVEPQQTNTTTEYEGVAPPGADVTVVTPAVVTVALGSTLTFKPGYSLDGAGATIALRGVIEANYQAYVNALKPGDDVVFNKAESTLFVEGVLDATSTTVGGGTSNISISDVQVARPGTITLA